MAFYICLPLVAILLQPAFCQYNCSSDYNRTPDNSDINVVCGATRISVEVDLCTARWSGFNETQLALNGAHNISDCLGTVDTSVNPPVIHFELPFNDSEDNPCRQSLQIVDEETTPDSVFSDFLSIQSVVLTGFIDTPRAHQGLVSYSTDLYYHFSCRFPLEYLLNDTEIVASSVSVATDEKNGSFINSLQIGIYNNSDYTHPLVVPPSGLKLRTSVFVAVEAINLTGNFNLLLDHCFSTPNAFNVSHSEKHSFFTGCAVDERATVISNGESKIAKFNFEAFRFLEHRDQTKSSVFVHCLLRLCEPDKCQELLSSCNNRKKRSLVPFGDRSKDSATVSAGPIYTEWDDTEREGNGLLMSSANDGMYVKNLLAVTLLGSTASVFLNHMI